MSFGFVFVRFGIEVNSTEGKVFVAITIVDSWVLNYFAVWKRENFLNCLWFYLSVAMHLDRKTS
jgi:hypothetical protein